MPLICGLVEIVHIYSTVCHDPESVENTPVAVHPRSHYHPVLYVRLWHDRQPLLSRPQAVPAFSLTRPVIYWL